MTLNLQSTMLSLTNRRFTHPGYRVARRLTREIQGGARVTEMRFGKWLRASSCLARRARAGSVRRAKAIVDHGGAALAEVRAFLTLHRARTIGATVGLATAGSSLLVFLLPHQWLELTAVVAIWGLALTVVSVLAGARRTLYVAALTITTGAALASVLGVDLAWAIHDSVRIHGTVACKSTANVVGVWVRTADGEGGWAQWAPTKSESIAAYSYVLKQRVRFRLGVGCGGTPQDWRADLVTPFANPGRRNFVCDDRGVYGRVLHQCRLTR